MLFTRSFYLGVLTKRTSLSQSIGAKPSVPEWRTSTSERVRRRTKGKKGKKELRARVKGKSANPVRRSHYRLGFDCSGSAGTGATRYTLYSASVRFLEIYSEKEGIHTGTHPSCSWTHVYVYKYIYCYPSTGLCSSRKERGEGKRARQGMSVDLWLCPTENPRY